VKQKIILNLTKNEIYGIIYTCSCTRHDKLKEGEKMDPLKNAPAIYSVGKTVKYKGKKCRVEVCQNELGDMRGESSINVMLLIEQAGMQNDFIPCRLKGLKSPAAYEAWKKKVDEAEEKKHAFINSNIVEKKHAFLNGNVSRETENNSQLDKK